jgi:hypothetical protein
MWNPFLGERNEELRDLNDESRRIRWAEHATQMWDKRNVYRSLVEKPEG